MANHQPSFFYAPTWDHSIANGPIQLGNVIASVKTPHRAIWRVSPPDSGLDTTEKKTVQFTREKLRRGKFSILTKFLSIMGFGVDIGAEVEKNDEEGLLFECLETTQFIPTKPYLQACVESDNVRQFLETSWFRKPVYVITGIKVVRGAQANTQKSRGVTGTLGVEVDGTLVTSGVVPVSGGPELEASVSKKSKASWAGSSDFVFAFRVSKVWVDRMTGQVEREEEYLKGAMLGEEQEEVKRPELSISKVEETSPEAEGFSVEELLEDEDTVLCAVPHMDPSGL